VQTTTATDPEEARRAGVKAAAKRRGAASTLTKKNVLGDAETTGTINLLGK
jgi:hypothetical protein